ncbi:MAG: hypothetical protein EBR50_07665 [Proteobacteria bacterium]|nr:hypothetical protein [Pseudomonadota bacterium]
MRHAAIPALLAVRVATLGHNDTACQALKADGTGVSGVGEVYTKHLNAVSGLVAHAARRALNIANVLHLSL